MNVSDRKFYRVKIVSDQNYVAPDVASFTTNGGAYIAKDLFCNQGARVGDTSTTIPGMIRFEEPNFFGYDGTSWMRFGSKGTTGSQGNQGPRGYQGSTGPTGNQGSTGPTGITGVQGHQGPQGPQGPQGNQGYQGPQGHQGHQGPTGVTGQYFFLDYYGKGNVAAQTIINDYQERDIAYVVLYDIISSFSLTPYIGNQIKPYFLYQWNSVSGAWGEVGLFGITGATGPQGHQGHQGPQGPRGHQGHQGPQGPQGNQGPRGYQGHQGHQGPQGSQGPIGPTGVTGQTGSTGVTGHQGHQGPTGVTGHQGHQGTQGPQGPQGHQGPTGSVTGGTGSFNKMILLTELSGGSYISENQISITDSTSYTVDHTSSNMIVRVNGTTGATGTVRVDDEFGQDGELMYILNHDDPTVTIEFGAESGGSFTQRTTYDLTGYKVLMLLKSGGTQPNNNPQWYTLNNP